MIVNTDSSELFVSSSKSAIPIYLLSKSDLKSMRSSLPKNVTKWMDSTGFKGDSAQTCLVGAANGGLEAVYFGLGSGQGNAKAMAHAKLARSLPKGTYRFADQADDADIAYLAWGMSGYSFTRYKRPGRTPPKLVMKRNDAVRQQTEAVYLVRDLINTPANDLGPDALEAVFRQFAKHHKAKTKVIKGDQLLVQNFPMIHAVGRASDQAPRLLDLVWGNTKHPKVTLVGKGVTFDTGGLNIKPGGSMSLMKKDMGGAANVLGLAHMIMAAKLPVRLRVLVGAVENAISGNAFRPGDVLQTRKGITVEIGNTDAEGRLVLGDCLALGDHEAPDLMIDMATLTGAARVALGPDLPPFYTDDEGLADELGGMGAKVCDPIWRMPLWQPYHAMMQSKVADVNHISTGGFAGSITAALFLSRFVEKSKSWVHFDIFGWVPTEKPWSPVGGEAQGIRTIFATLKGRYQR